MKLTQFFAVIAVVLLTTALGFANDLFPTRTIGLNARLNSPYISSLGGVAYLHVSVTTPNIGVAKRRPMNISVVLDRSGSMASEGKIDYAKRALNSLIDQLTNDDILSIVIYDDYIDVLRPAAPVRNKWEVKRLVESVYARGATNLGGGMMEGFRQVEQYVSKEFVNRVVLLSDGLANEGIVDPYQLNKIAKQYRSKSITITTMGVGLDYNENLMVGLANNGGGNYYFIESPNTLASILRKEFNMLSSIVAQNAVLELSLGKGVHLKDIIGCEYRPENALYLVPIGDLYANETREFTLELVIPPGRRSFTAASGVLRYKTEFAGLRRQPEFDVTIHYTDDYVIIEKNRDMETQAKADIAVSTRRVEKAMEAVDEGRMDDAAKELRDAKSVLMASPAASADGAGAGYLLQQAGELDKYEQLLKDSTDTRRAKKAIQYENYRNQRNKK
ncbi:MAG: VWA domain-containing protein [Ignavibacteriae bacterium]|nr:VWA domain-containing protein [Ignavibacteriota bacterium]